MAAIAQGERGAGLRRLIVAWHTWEGYLSLLQLLGRVREDVFIEDDVAFAVSLCRDVEGLDCDLEFGEAAKIRGLGMGRRMAIPARKVLKIN